MAVARSCRAGGGADPAARYGRTCARRAAAPGHRPAQGRTPLFCSGFAPGWQCGGSVPRRLPLADGRPSRGRQEPSGAPVAAAPLPAGAAGLPGSPAAVSPCGASGRAATSLSSGWSWLSRIRRDRPRTDGGHGQPACPPGAPFSCRAGKSAPGAEKSAACPKKIIASRDFLCYAPQLAYASVWPRLPRVPPQDAWPVARPRTKIT